jgi:non-heme chloroperoxidase
MPANSVELSSLLPAGSVLPFGEHHEVPTGDGGQLHSVVAGTGTPLVLTHGALMSLDAWALLWQPLLTAGHRLIGYDLRGHGRSTLGRSGFGVEVYAQDLLAVLDHFEVRGGVVVGHSTGGIGALALAVTAPVAAGRHLVGQALISTAAQGLGGRLQNRLLAPIVFSGLVHNVLRRRRLGTLFTSTLFGSHPDSNLVEFARRIMAAAPRQTTIEAPKAVFRFDFRDRLSQVELPTLVLCGGKDHTVKPEQAQALAERIPVASLQRYPDVGHLVVLERAEQITAAITRFTLEPSTPFSDPPDDQHGQSRAQDRSKRSTARPRPFGDP